MRCTLIGVAHRMVLRVKVPFAAMVRARAALVHSKLVIWVIVASLNLPVASMIRDRAEL